tara:strand:- start:2995 stop:3519 length:525 start_codon:yes stop_codon:yes gene_type:complete
MGTLNTTNLNVTGNWSSAPAGTIIQVQTAEAGPTRQTISSVNPVAITDLLINFTPKNSTSKIMIQVYLNATHTHVASYGIFEDGSKTTNTTSSGQSNGNENGMDFTYYNGSTTNDYFIGTTFHTVLDASSTTTRTYQPYATSAWSGNTYSIFINNRYSNDMPSKSRMIIYEIAT